MSITVRRSYDSQAEFDSALGYGWALNYFMRIYEYADGEVTLRRDCGVRRGFVLVGGAYQTPIGETGTLVRNPDLTWTYTEKNGERKEFDAEGRLSAIVSPQGPYLLFSYDARGKLPLIGLSPYAVDPQPKDIAHEYRLLELAEYATGGQPTGRVVNFTYDDATGRLTGLSDSAGRSVTYEHDGNGNLTQVSLPEGGVLHYDYQDPADPHNATTLTDSACPACGGAAYVNTYDSQDRVIRQEHGTNVMRITYVQAYLKTMVDEDVTDEQGNPLFTTTTTYEFNATGNPTKVTDVLGHQKVTEYDGNMSPIREERWENTGTPQVPDLVLRYVEERTYDSRGNLLTLTEAKDSPQQRVTTYTYDSGNNLLTITVPSVVDPLQNKVTSFTYDATGNALTQTEAGLLGNGTPYSYTTTYTYDANGQRTSVDGPRTDVSDVTTFAYDTITGNLSTVSQPGNLVTTYSNYTATGQPQTVTDPNLVATTFTYDSLGRVLTVAVGGGTTIYTYTPTGKVATVTPPRNNVTTYTYDSLDRVASLQDALGNSINHTYDSAGNRLKEEIKDPGGAVQKIVSFQYDTLKRLFRTVNPDASFTEYGYDYAGNRKSVKDPKGNTTTSAYDVFNRLVSTTQPGPAVTAYGYNAHNDLTSVTDAENHQTTYTYDDMGRVFQEVSPDTGTTTYGYDAAGNRTSKTDARGVAVGYQYDALNRLTRIDFPSDADIVYAYDACTNGKGRVCQVVDQAGTTSYIYDAKGQLAQETKTVLGIGYLTAYGYDLNGNQEAIAYPSGRLVSYSYDLADRVTSVTTTPPGGAAQTVAAGIGYKPYGGVSSLTYGNGLIRTVGYDNQYRITSIQTGAVQSLSYGYDPNGNVLTLTNNLDALKNKTFGYDALDRLSSATGPWGTLGYTYDKVGNRLSQTGIDPSTYSYTSGTNRLSSVSGAVSKTFGYDNAGNITLENSRTYVYNQNSRLVEASEGSLLGGYTQHANQQRATKTAGGEITVFHYDQSGRILAETNPAGQTSVEYIHLNNQPIAKADSTGFFFIHADHLGTPASMTNGLGATAWEIEARPFGDGATTLGTATLNLRFPGQYLDQETSLHQNWWREYYPAIGRYSQADPRRDAMLLDYGARYYDSTLGRFLSEDPILAEILNVLGDGPNLYAYVGARPTTFSDPQGLSRTRCPRSPPPTAGPTQSGRNCKEWYCRIIWMSTKGYRCAIVKYLSNCGRVATAVPCLFWMNVPECPKDAKPIPVPPGTPPDPEPQPVTIELPCGVCAT